MAPQKISFHAEPWGNDQADFPRAVVVIFGWWGAELRHVENMQNSTASEIVPQSLLLLTLCKS